jgi:Aspartyl protease/PDZ domain
LSKLVLALACAAFAATPCLAATPAEILAANKAATGGNSWNSPATMEAQYAYSGQGLTGTVRSTIDLKTGRRVQAFAIGPAAGAEGFDGKEAWSKDPSGTVTVQAGGEQRALAVNEGYRDANLWWQPGFGGATVAGGGEKTDGGIYDVVTVTPKDGKAFDAWFDAKTHLLSRVIEARGAERYTTTFSDYRAVKRVKLPYRIVESNGNPKYDSTLSLTNVTFAPARPDSAYAMPKVTIADWTIAGGAKETTFPFQLLNNHIYAAVKVNGQPFTFIFDTGGVNLVTPPTAKALGLKSEGQMQANGAGSGHMEAGLTKVASLQLGDATVKDKVFVVLPLDAMSNVEGVAEQGMVGYETFRRFVTRIDYGARTVTLIDPRAFDPKQAGTAIPITFNGNSIEVQASYDGHPGNFTVDTGARSALTLNAPFAAKNDLKAGGAKSVAAVTGWGVGGPTRSIVMRNGVLNIGPMSIPNPVVEIATDKGGAFSDASLAGNIGAGILKRYVLTLDYEHSTIYLEPVAAPVADLDTFDRSGMWINADPQGFKVVDVTATGPAEAAGLKPDDIITAVGGKPAAGVRLYELRQRLRDEPPGTAVTFAVQRGGQSKDVKVTLRDLI